MQVDGIYARAWLLLLAIALGLPVIDADAADTDRIGRLKRRTHADDVLDRAEDIRPRRSDSPLRLANLSDEEVRQIQRATLQVLPRALVNISGVTEGCPCEEGPQCSAEVWIVAYDQGKSTGLMLSTIDESWRIGKVQLWWLGYERHEASRYRYKSTAEYNEAEEQLISLFPTCAIGVSSPREDQSDPVKQ
jgi:hypothetical protein